jgi:hypothetical protein
MISKTAAAANSAAMVAAELPSNSLFSVAILTLGLFP